MGSGKGAISIQSMGVMTVFGAGIIISESILTACSWLKLFCPLCVFIGFSLKHPSDMKVCRCYQIPLQ